MNFLKVLVDGIFSSGKTEFIKNISEIPPVSAELPIGEMLNDPVLGSIALDFGRLTFGTESVLYFFGTPGSRIIRPEWGVGELMDLGIIWMVDSTFRHYNSHLESKSRLWRWHLELDLPMVVAANYQDLSDAWDDEMVRVLLRVPNEIPVIPCSAKTGEGVVNVLIKLCEEYLKFYYGTKADS